MGSIGVLKIFASLGIPGVTLFVYYMMFEDVARNHNPWLVALAMSLTAAIVFVALTRFPPPPPPKDKGGNNESHVQQRD